MSLFQFFPWYDAKNPATWSWASQRTAAGYERKVQELLRDEAQALTQLGIPVPTLKTKLSFRESATPREVITTFPTFEFPAHHCFRVQKLPELDFTTRSIATRMVRARRLPPPDFLLTYFVTGDFPTMLRVKEDFKTFGLGEVLKKYPGL